MSDRHRHPTGEQEQQLDPPPPVLDTQSSRGARRDLGKASDDDLAAEQGGPPTFESNALSSDPRRRITERDVPEVNPELEAVKREIDAEFESPSDDGEDLPVTRMRRTRAFLFRPEALAIALLVLAAVLAILPNEYLSMWMFWALMAGAGFGGFWLLKRIFRP